MTNALEAYAEATARKNGTWWSYKDEVRAIERLTGVSYALIQGPSRQAAIVAARWMVIAVLRQRGWSLLKIGRELNRDHTTIMYALGRMKQSNREAEHGL